MNKETCASGARLSASSVSPTKVRGICKSVLLATIANASGDIFDFHARSDYSLILLTPRLVLIGLMVD